ncbi:hypothetical protein P6144_06375 [Sphingomonas sp. HITSZ_GF]|uniref:hypothetical protein n=1 Tax=Sphingomonas sp. HITSZ_GF TaxID=3037247 RepID=UPI00240E7AE4|nr:hypothetical protein [Sphingomonas sp. HITSZ_GF]MDG2533265.1 hypothetical protein [Sphingomonas sp. HITSZ_GF]
MAPRTRGKPATLGDRHRCGRAGQGRRAASRRLAVGALYSGRAFLFELVTVLGNQE